MDFNKSANHLSRTDMYDPDSNNLHHYDQSLLLGNKYQNFNADHAYNQSVYSRPTESCNVPSIAESFPYGLSMSRMVNGQAFPQQSIDVRNSVQSSVPIDVQTNTQERRKGSTVLMTENDQRQDYPQVHGGTSPTAMISSVDANPPSSMEDAISNAWRLWSIGIRSVGALPVIDENFLGSNESHISDNNERKLTATNLDQTFDVRPSNSNLVEGNTDTGIGNGAADVHYTNSSSPLVPDVSHTGPYNQYPGPARNHHYDAKRRSSYASGYSVSNENNNFLNHRSNSETDYSFANNHMIANPTEDFESHLQETQAYNHMSLRMPFYQNAYSTSSLEGNQTPQGLHLADGRFITTYTPPILDESASYSGRKRAQSDSVTYNYLNNETQSTESYDHNPHTRNKRFRSMDLMYNPANGSEIQRYTQANKYYAEKGNDSLDGTYLGTSVDEYRYPIPWGPALDQTLSMPLFDIAPSDVGNSDARPRRQKVRFEGDLYTPQWVRHNGQAKEGFCQHCKPGKWLQLKNSAYWYHVQFYHGISATSGRYYRAPLQMSTFENGIKGLCHQCRDVVAVCHTKKKDMALWFRHAHKCHVHHKPKSLKKR